MTKKDLIIAASQICELSQKDTQAALDAVLAVITEGLKNGEKITISGFGSFDVKFREARMGRNLNTGEPVSVPATYVPGFTPGESLKKAVKEKE